MLGGFGNNPEKEAAMEKWFSGGELTDLLIKLEKSLPINSNGWFSVGKSVSYADLSIWHLLKDYFNDIKAVKLCEENANCVRISKIADSVASLPAVEQWVKNRPNSIF